MTACSACIPQPLKENTQLKFLTEHWDTEFGYIFDDAIMWDALAREFMRVDIMSEEEHEILLKDGPNGLKTSVHAWIMSYLTQQQCGFIRDYLIKHLYMFVIECAFIAEADVRLSAYSRLFWPDSSCNIPLMDWNHFMKTKREHYQYPIFQAAEPRLKWADCVRKVEDQDHSRKSPLFIAAYYITSLEGRGFFYTLDNYYRKLDYGSENKRTGYGIITARS